MRISLKRTLAKITLVTFGCASLIALPSNQFVARAAGTPVGTAILNQAQASYTDAGGTTYNTLSNTVTTTVQNAASLAIAPGAAQNTVPGGQLTDTFTVTNTGNGIANFNLTFGAQTGSDAGSATVAGYYITLPAAYTGPAVAGCTAVGGSTKIYSCIASTGPTSSAAANANLLLGNAPVASGAMVLVGVVYNVATTATAGTSTAPQTIVTPLNGTSTQSTVNNPTSTVASTSQQLATPPTETDSVVTDARLDMQKGGTSGACAGNNPATGCLTYVIDAADGGASPAHDLASVKALLGSTAQGVLITDKIPQFNGVPLAVQSASATGKIAAGFLNTGATETLYYTTVANGASGWTLLGTGTPPAGITYIGVFVSGGANGIEFLSNYGTTGATTGGNVSSTQAAVALTLNVAAPTGSGSANPNSAVNQADSVIGSATANPNPDPSITNAPVNIIGPNVPANTPDSASVTNITATGQGINYPTPATPSTTPGAPGASNSVGNNATATASPLVGPYGFPGATGSYNGVAANNNSDDFSAVAFDPAYTSANTSTSGGVTGNALGATATVSVANTAQNNGNGTDTLTVSVAAPAGTTGWTVQIFKATATGTATGAALATNSPTTPAVFAFTGVPSGTPTDTANTISYVVTYTAPATATGLTVYDSTTTVTSQADPTMSNTTHDELLPGGPIALTKTASLDATTCPGGNAVPGCIITYSVAYTNIGGTNGCTQTPTTIPTYQQGYYAKNVTITENGKLAPSTWGTTYTSTVDGSTQPYTLGLNPNGSGGTTLTDTTTGTTFTGNTVGSYLLTSLIGGSGSYLAPGCSGMTKFTVTVNKL